GRETFADDGAVTRKRSIRHTRSIRNAPHSEGTSRIFAAAASRQESEHGYDCAPRRAGGSSTTARRSARRVALPGFDVDRPLLHGGRIAVDPRLANGRNREAARQTRSAPALFSVRQRRDVEHQLARLYPL